MKASAQLRKFPSAETRNSVESFIGKDVSPLAWFELRAECLAKSGGKKRLVGYRKGDAYHISHVSGTSLQK